MGRGGLILYKGSNLKNPRLEREREVIVKTGNSVPRFEVSGLEATGHYHVVLRTQDGGKTWLKIPTPRGLTGVQFADSKNGVGMIWTETRSTELSKQVARRQIRSPALPTAE